MYISKKKTGILSDFINDLTIPRSSISRALDMLYEYGLVHEERFKHKNIRKITITEFGEKVAEVLFDINNIMDRANNAKKNRPYGSPTYDHKNNKTTARNPKRGQPNNQKTKKPIDLPPRTFHTIRRKDESNTTTTEKILNGCLFPDGLCVIRWCSTNPNVKPSTAIYNSFKDFKFFHIDRHSDNPTEIIWHDR